MSEHEQESLRNNIVTEIRSYNDFPSKGVLFRDFLPIFIKPSLLNSLCKFIAESYRGKVDTIVGLESRGFLFGPIVALDLNLPFVPIRKKGKLPGQVWTSSYEKEYGQDTLEIQKSALAPGQRVLIVDDLLATGGTMCAAVQLLNEANAKLSAIFVVIELEKLAGRAKLGEFGKMVNSLPKVAAKCSAGCQEVRDSRSSVNYIAVILAASVAAHCSGRWTLETADPFFIPCEGKSLPPCSGRHCQALVLRSAPPAPLLERVNFELFGDSFLGFSIVGGNLRDEIASLVTDPGDSSN